MAQNKGRKFGGPRYNKPHEVHDKLEGLGKNFNEFYDKIMRHIFIRWDLDVDDVWVQGRFRASSGQMIRWTGLSKSGFYIKWRQIIDAGLIRLEDDGVWVVTMVIKKEEVAVSDVEMKRMQQQQLEMSGELQLMREKFENVSGILEKLKSKKSGSEDPDESTPVDDLSTTPDKNGSSVDSPILLKGLNKKDSLSGSNIISGFYTGLGQNTIPKKKRERASNILKELRREGFSLEDIAFAVEWTLEDPKEELYDFSIIQHTISQALAARDRIEAENREQEERDKAAEEEILKREAEDQEIREIEDRKANLSADQCQKLREEARAALGQDGLSADMLTEFLVNIKENELLRKQLEEKR